jgi:hypothetical protein
MGAIIGKTYFGNNIVFGLGNPPESSFDADAQAYIDEVLAVGGTLSAGDQTAINSFYVDLKANSLYTELKYMYPFMGGVSASNAIEGLAPTDANRILSYTGSLLSASAHTSAGVDCTAASFIGRATQNNSPSSYHSSINDITIGAYVSTAITNDENFVISSTIDNTNRYQMNIPFDSNNVYGGIGINTFAIYNNGAAPVGRWIASRTSTTNLTTYKNGSSVVTQTANNSSGVLSTSNIIFFNSPVIAVPQRPFNGVCGFIFGANGLSGAEISTFDGILSTFLTAIGR